MAERSLRTRPEGRLWAFLQRGPRVGGHDGNQSAANGSAPMACGIGLMTQQHGWRSSNRNTNSKPESLFMADLY